MSPADQVLVERWRKHRDADAFAELVSRYAGMVYATCRRVLNNASEAEDVAQECFLKLATTDAGIRTSVPGWLHRVATNRSLDRLESLRRRAARERRFAADLPAVAGDGVEDLQRHVDEAIANLPEFYRAPLLAHFFAGQSYEELARAFGIPRSTAAYRVRRAVELVRRQLAKKGVVVPAAALASSLAGQAAQAAPASLVAALCKVAIAGAAMPGMAFGATLGGAVLMKKALLTLAVVAAVLAVGLGVHELRNLEPKTVSNAVAATEDGGGLATPADVATPESEVRPSPLEKTTLQATAAESAAAIGSGPAVARVAGRVTSAEGAPFPGAEVRLTVTRDLLGYDLVNSFTAATGPDGSYAIEGIDAFGKGWLSAAAVGFAGAPGKRELTLVAGSRHEGNDFALGEADFVVTGQVVNTVHQPVPRALVDLVHCGYSEDLYTHGRRGTGTISNVGHLARTCTDDHGRFELPLPKDGLCDLRVTKDGYGVALFGRISPGPEEVVLVLRGEGLIAGHVRTPEGRPVAGVVVEAMGQAGVAGFDPADGVATIADGFVRAETDAEGAYRLGGLGESFAYTVSVHDPRVLAEFIDYMGQHPDDTMAELLRYSTLRAAEEEPGRKCGVRVAAGRTTTVDLVYRPASRLYGRVTGEGNGVPVYPFCVEVFAPEEWDADADAARPLARAFTDADGAYSVLLELDGPTRICVQGEYWHFAGSDECAKEPLEVQMDPGAAREFSFSVPGPITVPVRYVDDEGRPRADVGAAIRPGGQSGGWRGRQDVGPDGRAILVGLPPDVPLQAVAIGPGGSAVGVSAAFVGKPGESLPEVTVACGLHGGIQGSLVDSEGKPEADTLYWCRGRGRGDELTDSAMIRTDSGGRFNVTHALPEGEYSEVYLSRWDADSSAEAPMAVVTDVSIAAGEVADLGAVTVTPAPADTHGAVGPE